MSAIYERLAHAVDAFETTARDDANTADDYYHRLMDEIRNTVWEFLESRDSVIAGEWLEETMKR